MVEEEEEEGRRGGINLNYGGFEANLTNIAGNISSHNISSPLNLNFDTNRGCAR